MSVSVQSEQKSDAYVERLRELRAKRRAEYLAKQRAEGEQRFQAIVKAMKEIKEIIAREIDPIERRRARMRFAELVNEMENCKEFMNSVEQQANKPLVEVYDDDLAQGMIFINKIFGDGIFITACERLVFFFRLCEAKFWTKTRFYEEMINRCTKGEELTPIREGSVETLRTRYNINQAIKSFDQLGIAGFIDLMQKGFEFEVEHVIQEITAARNSIVLALEGVHERLERIGLTVEEATDPLRKRNTRTELKYDIECMIRAHKVLIETFDRVLELLVAKKANRKELNSTTCVSDILRSANRELLSKAKDVQPHLRGKCMEFRRNRPKYSEAIGRCENPKPLSYNRSSFHPLNVQYYVKEFILNALADHSQETKRS